MRSGLRDTILKFRRLVVGFMMKEEAGELGLKAHKAVKA